MQSIPIRTTRAHTRKSGETVHITKWTIGAYTLRKSEDPYDTSWAVTTSARNLPYIRYNDGGPHRPFFSVSAPSSGELSPLDALKLAEQITEAAHIAATFGIIVAGS